MNATVDQLIALSKWTTGGIESVGRAVELRPGLLEQAAYVHEESRASGRNGSIPGDLIRRMGRFTPPPLPTEEEIGEAESRCPSGPVYRSIRKDEVLWVWWCGGYWPAEATRGYLREY